MDSPGSRRWISDRTVRPPTPESKTAIGRWSGETTAAVSGRPRPRPVCGGARGGRRRCCGRPSRSGRRAGRDERHALVVGGQDQPRRTRPRSRCAGRAPPPPPRLMPPRRIGAVEDDRQLGRRVADGGETSLAMAGRTAWASKVRTWSTRSGVEEGEHSSVSAARVSTTTWPYRLRRRQRLLDVAGGDHLGHLDPRRGEEDVDARRITEHHLRHVASRSCRWWSRNDRIRRRRGAGRGGRRTGAIRRRGTGSSPARATARL